MNCTKSLTLSAKFCRIKPFDAYIDKCFTLVKTSISLGCDNFSTSWRHRSAIQMRLFAIFHIAVTLGFMNKTYIQLY